MLDFAFYMHDGSGTAPSFEVGQFETRETALRYGQLLLDSRPCYVELIVTEGEAEIACLRRTRSV